MLDLVDFADIRDLSSRFDRSFELIMHLKRAPGFWFWLLDLLLLVLLDNDGASAFVKCWLV